MVPQKGRSGQDFERFTARERRDAEFRELSLDCGCGAAVFVEERALGSPLRCGFFKDASCVLAAVARGLALEAIAHLTHETLAVCERLGKRPIKTEALAHEKLEVCAANAIALRVSRAFARDAVCVAAECARSGGQKALCARRRRACAGAIRVSISLRNPTAPSQDRRASFVQSGTGRLTQAAPAAR